MAFQIKNATAALAIVVLVGAALLGVGCGKGDGGSIRAVEWGIVRPVGPNWVRISAVVRACSPDAPLLEPPIIKYMGNRVEIELRRTPEDLEGKKGCFLQLFVPQKKITFEQDLNELVLYDPSTDPPEKRWPRDLPWRKK